MSCHVSFLFGWSCSDLLIFRCHLPDALCSMDFAAFKLLYEATFVPSRYTFYSYLLVPVFTFLTSAYLAPDQPYEMEDDSTSSEGEPPARLFRMQSKILNFDFSYITNRFAVPGRSSELHASSSVQPKR